MATNDMKTSATEQKGEDAAYKEPVRDGTLKEARATGNSRKEETVKPEVLRDGTLKEARNLSNSKKNDS